MHPFTDNAELAKTGARIITGADGVTLTAGGEPQNP
jgi:putrescine aminotransferase